MIKNLFIALAFISALPVSSFAQEPVSKNVAVFFEIPVTNFDRAVKFYEEIMATKLRVDVQPEYSMAFFPAAADAATGALSKMSEAKPSADGPIIYLNGGADLQTILDRVVPAGGKVVIGKTLIGAEVGYFAFFLDSEGNRLGLFSRK